MIVCLCVWFCVFGCRVAVMLFLVGLLVCCFVVLALCCVVVLLRRCVAVLMVCRFVGLL